MIDDDYSSYAEDRGFRLPSPLYGYRRLANFRYTYRSSRYPYNQETADVPVCCCCKSDYLCGCDNPEPYRNFTYAVIDVLYDVYTLAHVENGRLTNSTNVCDV
ncbi:hypothetical protein BJX96DRAFT_156996 [Aspergillus floccosus]